jgi:curved DNA-binding protein CbpA
VKVDAPPGAEASPWSRARARPGASSSTYKGNPKSSDPYDVLGVARNATQDEIKKAWRGGAARFHPDKHPGDTEAAEDFKALSNANDVLSNPEKRAAYDATARPPSADAASSVVTPDPPVETSAAREAYASAVDQGLKAKAARDVPPAARPVYGSSGSNFGKRIDPQPSLYERTQRSRPIPPEVYTNVNQARISYGRALQRDFDAANTISDPNLRFGRLQQVYANATERIGDGGLEGIVEDPIVDRALARDVYRTVESMALSGWSGQMQTPAGVADWLRRHRDILR